MNQLKHIMDEYLAQSVSASAERPDVLGSEGAGSAPAVPDPEHGNRLRTTLYKYHKSNSRKINIIFVVLVALVALGIYLALFNQGNTENYRIIFGGAGIFATLTVLIKLLLDAVRDKVAMDILLTSQPDLSAEQFRTVVEAAATRLFK